MKKDFCAIGSLFIFCVLLLLVSTTKLFNFIQGQFLYVLVVLLACYVAMFDNWKRFIGRFILLFIASYSCLYFGSILGFGFPIEDVFADVLSVALATNVNEVGTFFANFIAQKPIRLTCSLICLIAFAIIFLLFNCRCSYLNIFNKRLSDLSVIVLIFVFSIIVTSNGVEGSFSSFFDRLPAYISQVNQSIEAGKARQDFKWDAVASVKGRQTVVLILGETTRGDHMQVAGYPRETTPQLSKENLIVFKDAISIGYHTLLSTPFMLTRKPVVKNNIYGLFGETSIISAFKEAGFKTYYVSYLKPIVKGDNAINQIVAEADVYIQRPLAWGGAQDSLYLPIVKQLIENGKDEKKLIVVKLIGSHFNYQDMYPKEFDKFQPSFKTSTYIGPDPSKKDVFINTYDNSILHTDYVVSTIIGYLKTTKNEDVLLSFISDHGTSIYEDGKTLYGGMKKANYNAAMFFWFGDKATKRLSKEISIMRENAEKPIDSTHFVDTILSLSGVATPKKVGKDLLSDRLPSEDDRQVIFGTDIVPFKKIH